MSLLPAKRVVLESLLLSDGPLEAAQIAKDTGNKLNSTNLHLIWLVRAGYVVSPEKGKYMIADSGKKVLGIPEVTRETAMGLLAQSQKEMPFQFYEDLGKPLELYADGIKDFLEKIPRATTQSLEFHMGRGDFENWFDSLGDVEMSKKMGILRNKKLLGEQLRVTLYGIVERRCAALSKLLQ
jgi:hypothetical protein